MAFADALSLGKKGAYKYALTPCIDCGLERWVALKHGKPRSARCYSCSNRIGRTKYMEENGNWRGGRRRQIDGYIMRTLPLDHPLREMTTNMGQVREHRIIMAEHLGRPLKTDELIHHLNGVRSDNRIENLMLVSNKNHEVKTREKLLRQRILELEKELNKYKEAYGGSI